MIENFRISNLLVAVALALSLAACDTTSARTTAAENTNDTTSATYSDSENRGERVGDNTRPAKPSPAINDRGWTGSTIGIYKMPF